MSHAISRKPMAPVAVAPRSPSPPRPSGTLAWTKKYVLVPVASLRLTVVLFTLSIFLVFAGTLAQVDNSVRTVEERYFRTGLAWIPYQVFVRLGQVFFYFPKDLEIPGSFPFPGGWLLGGLLLANLLTAHALRFRFTWKDALLLPAFAAGGVLLWYWQEEPSFILMALGAPAMVLSLAGLLIFHGKRGGVILLHLGLIVMMLSELVTGLYAAERTMTIAEEETASFLEMSRANELAIIDRTNPKMDDVVVIPESVLRKGGVIRNPLLPFEVVVDRYFVNAIPQPLRPGQPNPATAGDGLFLVAHERPEVSGTDSSQQRDVASAYVTLKRKDNGEPLGTYLVSQYFDANFTNRMLSERPQRVALNGKNYELFLRPTRVYTPYRIELLEFRNDKFQGTDKPKNYSSLIRLTDPERHEQREVKIYMNHPLRYAGETFYQSGVLGGQKGTILQVVHNPGWLMPYISCIMVACGMVLHFCFHLLRFVGVRV
jgi:ResB-like family